MKRAFPAAAVAALVAIGGAAFWAFAGGKMATCSQDAATSDMAACETGSSNAAGTPPPGKALGNFDPTMAGCSFACATKLKYDAESVIAQPGARDGRLTQCPVSGVVFNVDENRPHVQIGADDYVTCCSSCAGKLGRNPGRFVRL